VLAKYRFRLGKVNPFIKAGPSFRLPAAGLSAGGLFYIGKSLAGPMPKDVLHTPIFYTVCLLTSSFTIHTAVRKLRGGNRVVFACWWLLTILLGGTFLFGTAREWRRLIFDEGLTVSTRSGCLRAAVLAQRKLQ
jgi:hypothetical protein